MNRLSIDKFAEGFTAVCSAYSVDPESVIKKAQAIDTRKGGYGSPYGSAIQNTALGKKLQNATRFLPYGGRPDVVPTGRAAKPDLMPQRRTVPLGATARRMTQSQSPLVSGVGRMIRPQESVTPTGRAARPDLMPYRSTGQQFARELGAMTPGLAVGREMDLAEERMRELEQEKNLTPGSTEWLLHAIRNYGGAGIRGFTVPTGMREYVEEVKDSGRTARDVFDPEGAKERARQAEIAERQKARREHAEFMREQQEEHALSAEQIRRQYQKDVAAWNRRKVEAAEAGKEFDEPMPEMPNLEWRGGQRRRPLKRYVWNRYADRPMI